MQADSPDAMIDASPAVRTFVVDVARPGRAQRAGFSLPRWLSWGGVRLPALTPPPPGPLSGARSELRANDERRRPLTAAARRMLADLRPDMSTEVLERQYPQVLNELAAVKDRVRDLRRVADHLIYQEAAGRPPLDVAAVIELSELKDHLLRTTPRWQPSVWDEAYGLAGKAP